MIISSSNPNPQSVSQSVVPEWGQLTTSMVPVVALKIAPMITLVLAILLASVLGWELTSEFSCQSTDQQPTFDDTKQLIHNTNGFCFPTNDVDGSGSPWMHCYCAVCGDYWYLYHRPKSSSSTAFQQWCLAHFVTGSNNFLTVDAVSTLDSAYGDHGITLSIEMAMSVHVIMLS